MRPGLKNLLFDLDGTLTDPYLGISRCIHHALDKMSLAKTEDLRWCIGPPLHDSFAKLLHPHRGDRVQEAVTHFRERFTTVGILENEVYAGISEMLQTLSKTQYRLFIATSKPHVFASRVIEQFGLGPYFENIYGSELDGTRSDKRHLIRHLLETEGILPSESVMIGDTKFDLEGARSNLINGISITWGYGDVEELRKENPYAMFHTPAELTRFLLNQSE